MVVAGVGEFGRPAAPRSVLSGARCRREEVWLVGSGVVAAGRTGAADRVLDPAQDDVALVVVERRSGRRRHLREVNGPQTRSETPIRVVGRAPLTDRRGG